MGVLALRLLMSWRRPFRSLFPGTKLAIGPPIEEGFYYDFDVEKPFSDEDLARIEKRMTEIMAGKHRFQREDDFA